MSASPSATASSSSSSSASTSSSAAAWPTWGIIPKRETEAQQFVEKYPTYDGRGVVVSVFDTGVDPGSAGLQVTSDGRPKIIDIVDGTGSGDVDTSTIVRASATGTLTGLTGRTLTIGKDWKNPSGEYRLGIKRAFELFPKELVARVKASRREKWAVNHRTLEAELHKQISATGIDKKEKAELETRLAELNSMEKSCDEPGPVYDCVVFNDGTNWRAAIDTKESGDLTGCKLLTDYRFERQYDTFSTDDLMNYSVNIYEDGRVLSIVVNAGSHGTHVAGIVGAFYPDQPESNGIAPGCQIVSVKIGDSRLGSMETGAGLERGLKAALNSKSDLINMSYGEATSRCDTGRFHELATELVNKHGIIFISSAGNAGPGLSTAGAPGATSAAIIGVGAYVAPSVMATGYSLIRPLPETQFTWSSRGPTYDGALGVSVSACGGAIAPVPTWTLAKNQLMAGTSMASPACCGGVALVLSGLKARGKKYGPWGIRRAIENTARALTGAGTDPFSTGHGLLQINAAFDYADRHAEANYENVIFQVSVPARPAARGIYLREAHESTRVLETAILVTPVFPEQADEVKEEKADEKEETKGEAAPASPSSPVSAPLSLSALTSTPTSVRATVNKSKLELEVRVVLRSTASWVTASSHVMIMYGGKSFTISVDPRGLAPGVHFAEVLGFDTANEARGPLVRVPVTVLVPEPTPFSAEVKESRELQASVYRFPNLLFNSAQIHRKFIVTPDNATWAEVVLTGKGWENKRLFMLSAGFLLPETPHRDLSSDGWWSMSGHDENTTSLAVTPGAMLEIAVAQFWSSLGEATADLEVIFHSLTTGESEVVVHGARGSQRLTVWSPFRAENVSPVASLTTLRQPVRPANSEIRPLRDARRDDLPRGRTVYELILTYNWEAKERASVTPRALLLQGVLYEAVLGSQFWMIFDANKQFVGSGDSWPSGTSLAKGKYTIRLQIRYDRVATLESLRDMPIVIDSKLGKSASIPVYSTFNDLVSKGASFGSKLVEAGGRRALWLGAADLSGVKNAAPGDILYGVLTLGNGGPKTPHYGDSDKDKRPSKLHLEYVVPPAPITRPAAPASSSSSSSSSSSAAPAAAAAAPTAAASVGSDTKESKEGATDAVASPSAATAPPTPAPSPLELEIRDHTIESIGKQSGEKQLAWFNELTPALLSKWPRHLPLLSLRLTVQLGRKDKTPQDVIDAADAVIAEVKHDELAAHYGLLRPADDEKLEKQHKEFEKIKEQLLEALFRKAEAVADQIKAIDKAAKSDEKKEAKENPDRATRVTALRAALSALGRWSERKETKFLQLNLFEHLLDNRLGHALKALNAGIAASAESGSLPAKDLLVSRADLLEQLRWTQWAAYERVWISLKYPKDYTLF